MGFSSRVAAEREMVPGSYSGLPDDEEAEVSLAHFAAICGMTRREFLQALYGVLTSQEVARLLKEKAQEDFLEWVAERSAAGDKELLLFMRLSLNRKRDVGLFCVLGLESPEDFPRIPVKCLIPGFGGCPPRKYRGLDGFEVSFCDLETACFGGLRCQAMSRSKSTRC